MLDFGMFQNLGINFGYKSPLKDVVDVCAYTGKKLTRKARTLEHIHPHSRGGVNFISNYLIAEAPINRARGNMRFDKWLRKKPEVIGHIQDYLNKFRGLKVHGRDYVETVKHTLNREARGVVTFSGRKNLDIKA